MSRSQTESLLSSTQSFFQNYLRQTRGASAHTVRAYRDALKLFFLFLADHERKPVAGLTLDDVRANPSPGVSGAYRNQARQLCHHAKLPPGGRAELCAVSSPTRCDPRRAVRRDPCHTDQTGYAPDRYLLGAGRGARVDAAIGAHSRHGERDRALLLFLYNTGARVAEALSLRPSALRLDRPRQVRLFGKGSKERICPLWPETATALRRIIRAGSGDDSLFKNATGGPLSRDGVAYLIRKHARTAAERCPALRKRRITPHVLRHSCACALLQAGVDITVIRDYLGHSSVATTSRYVSTNLHMKRDALEAFWKRAGLEAKGSRKWRPSPELLTFLETL